MGAHDERIIGLFAKKEKRERLLFLATKAARRDDLVTALLHDTRSLDRARLAALDAKEIEVAAIAKRLGARPSSLAYCITSIAEVDGRELPLGEALLLVVGRERDALVFCLAAATAFYENHEGQRFILAAG